jgi:hypothetical protein
MFVVSFIIQDLFLFEMTQRKLKSSARLLEMVFENSFFYIFKTNHVYVESIIKFLIDDILAQNVKFFR